MRVIKFRVFDNYTKSMHMCGQDSHDTISFSYPDNQAYYYNLQNGEGSSKDDDGQSTYELMQYTGLKDKYRKEICEGDIGWNNHSEYYGLVKFETGKFIYEWDNICEDLSEAHDGIEIVGNIYENPELLEKEQSK